MTMEINRRRMLLGLAAASTAAATINTAAAARTENPRLVALAAKLPIVAAAFHEVNEPHLAAFREWQSRTPWAPEELTVRGTGWPNETPHQPGETEMKVLGGFLLREGDDFPRRIVIKAAALKWRIHDVRLLKRRAKKSGNLPDFMAAEAEIGRLTKLYNVARNYEQEFKALKDEAGAWHKKSLPIKEAVRDALERHVATMMKEDDVTMEGLVIKAQALAEWERVGKRWGERLALMHGQDWQGQIAASILRHARGEVKL